MKDKNKLFIVEPFSSDSAIKSVVVKAYENGVPAKNIIGGSIADRGKDVVPGYTPTPPGIDHWGALKFIGGKL